MHRHTRGHVLHRLDGLTGRPDAVRHGHGNGHGLMHRARRIDRGAPGFIREADEVGIGKAAVFLDLRNPGPCL